MIYEDEDNIIFCKNHLNYKTRVKYYFIDSLIGFSIYALIPIAFIFIFDNESFFIILCISLVYSAILIYGGYKTVPSILINSVYINNDKLVIYYYFKDDLRKIILDLEDVIIDYERPGSINFYWKIIGVIVREKEKEDYVLTQSNMFKTWRTKDSKALVRWWRSHQKRVMREKKANQNKN